MFDDFWSTRIDISCPRCQQSFKVRLRKLQFGSELVCRLCRHEFEAHPESDLPEVQAALAHMHRIVRQRAKRAGRGHSTADAASRSTEAPKVAGHRAGRIEAPTTKPDGK